MKFVLKDYQTDAVADTIAALGEGVARFQRSERLTAVSLSAPTGAGKTVIATAVIERLFCGDENNAPNPEMTVLWVTDDPSLNQQTIKKMRAAGSEFRPRQLVTVDSSLDQETLNKGTVYFVHIQQLGKGASNYVRTGDNRRWSMWTMIGNTVQQRGANFLLIIDEAHKGTAAKKEGEKTITSRLIDGAGGALPATPVVLGISATPTRFNEAISKAGQRVLEPVVVDPELVRESGLIKDKIRIKHPMEAQPGDSTLLELAAKDLKAYDEMWDTYSKIQGEPHVNPALVIQVKAKVSDAELRETLETLFRSWPDLSGRAIGHSFQDHTTLNLGTESIRYIAPQDIQDDPDLRVVLFKEALTTGWDCPRAEVMLSFRTAKDYTYIAQLIGRMVRTPLARRVATNDVLNTVALYLPYYDEEQVTQVVNGIQSDEGQIASRIEIDAVVCGRNPVVSENVWHLIEELPTYTRPAKNHRNEVARLNALAIRLTENDLEQNAAEKARIHITDTIKREARRIGSVLEERMAEYELLDYQTQNVDLGTGDIETENASVAINLRNIEDLFRRARRTLGDAAAKWYWDDLCDAGIDPEKAKIQTAVLADDSSVPSALEAAAQGLIDTWRNEHNAKINILSDAKRAAFYDIWQQAREPQLVTPILPEQITAPGQAERRPKHLFANGRNLFPASFTGWEAEVVSVETTKESLVAWYRNSTGGTSAIGVPYQESGRARTLYPDFFFCHDVDGETVVDLIDPHRPDASDTAPKWSGLADYAKKHARSYRRVLAVIKNTENQLVSLDLKNPAVAPALKSAISEADVRKIFEDFGGPYS